MENASKALLIAGGVLIALIITMFLVMFNNMSNLQNQQEEQLKIEQLAAFNAEYEAYNKKVMYGTDVVTLLNKVAQNNIKYNNSLDYKIEIIVNVKIAGTETTIVNGKGEDLLAIEDSELSIFKCTKMEYNNLGRVSKIQIESK